MSVESLPSSSGSSSSRSASPVSRNNHSVDTVVADLYQSRPNRPPGSRSFASGNSSHRSHRNNERSRSFKRNSDTFHSSNLPSRSRTNSRIRDLETDTTFGSNNDPSQLNLNLQRMHGNNNQDPAIKTYHMVTWNNKTYRLTQLYNDGTTVRQIGFTETDWDKIAQKQIAVWNAALQANPQFTFSNSSLNVESGTFKYRQTAGEPVQTIDCNDQNSPAQHAATRTAITALKDLFAPANPNRVKHHPMETIRGNPPQPTLASEKPNENPPLDQPQDVLNNPPVPEPESVDWWRFDKKIKNFFTGIFNPPTQSVPKLNNP